MINIREVCALVCSGIDYNKYCTYCAMRGMHCISRDSFFEISYYIYSVIETICTEEFEKVADELRERESWVATCDAGWSHWGWCANEAWYPVRDFETGKIVCMLVLQKPRVQLSKGGKQETLFEGNYKGSSKSMEGYAFQLTVDWLSNHDILKNLKHIVMDKDGCITNLFKCDERCKHITPKYDPGHCKKTMSHR